MEMRGRAFGIALHERIGRRVKHETRRMLGYGMCGVTADAQAVPTCMVG